MCALALWVSMWISRNPTSLCMRRLFMGDSLTTARLKSFMSTQRKSMTKLFLMLLKTCMAFLFPVDLVLAVSKGKFQLLSSLVKNRSHFLGFVLECSWQPLNLLGIFVG